MSNTITLGINKHFIGEKSDFDEIKFLGIGSCIAYVLTDGKTFCAAHCSHDIFDSTISDNPHAFVESSIEEMLKILPKYKTHYFYVVGGSSITLGFDTGRKNVAKTTIMLMDNNFNVKNFSCGGSYSRSFRFRDIDDFDVHTHDMKK